MSKTLFEKGLMFFNFSNFKLMPFKNLFLNLSKKQLLKSININQELENSYLLMSIMFFNNKDEVNFLKYINEALRFSKENKFYYHFLKGLFYYEKNNLDKALKIFYSILDYNLEDIWFIYLLSSIATIESKLEKYNLSIKRYKELIKKTNVINYDDLEKDEIYETLNMIFKLDLMNLYLKTNQLNEFDKIGFKYFPQSNILDIITDRIIKESRTDILRNYLFFKYNFMKKKYFTSLKYLIDFENYHFTVFTLNLNITSFFSISYIEETTLSNEEMEDYIQMCDFLSDLEEDIKDEDTSIKSKKKNWRNNSKLKNKNLINDDFFKTNKNKKIKNKLFIVKNQKIPERKKQIVSNKDKYIEIK